MSTDRRGRARQRDRARVAADATVNGAPSWALAGEQLRDFADRRTASGGGFPARMSCGSLGNTATGLPAGHPFTASAGSYWTSAPSSFDPAFIVTVDPTTSFVHWFERIARWHRARLVRARRRQRRHRCAIAIPGDLAFDPTRRQRWRRRLAVVAVPRHRRRRERCLGPRDGACLASDAGRDRDQLGGRRSTRAHASARSPRRLGWRLPTLAEQLSLYTSTGTGTLPTGHPFVGITGRVLDEHHRRRTTASKRLHGRHGAR